MKKIIYFIITYIVCRILGLSDVWLGFAATYAVLLFTKMTPSLFWEIPMGTLASAISISAMGGDFAALLRILIPCAGVIIAYTSTKRLAIFFPAAVLALFFKNVYFAAAMCAFIWCGVKFLFPQKYSNTTKPILQATAD